MGLFEGQPRFPNLKQNQLHCCGTMYVHPCWGANSCVRYRQGAIIHKTSPQKTQQCSMSAQAVAHVAGNRLASSLFCECSQGHATAFIWRSEDILQESVFFHHVGPGYRTQNWQQMPSPCKPVNTHFPLQRFSCLNRIGNTLEPLLTF